MSDVNEVMEAIKDDSFEKALQKKTRYYRNGFIARIVIFIILICSVVVYPLLPISQVRGLKLQGNYLLTKKEILNIVDDNISPNLPVIFLNEQKLEDTLEASPIIESCEVKWRPFDLLVVIDEVAAMINYEDKTYLSNGSTIEELEANNPGFIYNFQASDLPEYIGSMFGHFENERRTLFLNNLKTIDRSILTTVEYIDYRGDGSSTKLTDGFVCFYFEGTDNIYNRVCVQEAYLSHFLTNKILPTILERIEQKENAKITVDSNRSDISYRSITCYYGSKVINGQTYNNPCIVDVES